MAFRFGVLKMFLYDLIGTEGQHRVYNVEHKKTNAGSKLVAPYDQKRSSSTKNIGLPTER